MTGTLNKELPLCCLCETPTESGVQDAALGLLCYPCRNEAAQAESALSTAGMLGLLSIPKNNHQP